MSTVRALLVSMRPRQWTKNLLVFAPLIFANELMVASRLLAATLTFVALCLLSGAVYVMNDVVDLERDRLHEKKCQRPLARGDVSKRTAVVFSCVCGGLALATALVVAPGVLYVCLGYLVLQAAYSLRLKHEVILDVFSIAAGFVLRAAAGAAAVGAALSPWLYAAVSLLALFLGFGKRRHELLTLDAEACVHRPSLEHYSPQLLDALLSSVTAATIVTYAIYSFSSATAQRADRLYLTVPFVAYGLFRYLYLIYKRDLGGNPEEILLTDAPIILSIVLWLGTAVFAMYVR